MATRNICCCWQRAEGNKQCDKKRCSDKHDEHDNAECRLLSAVCHDSASIHICSPMGRTEYPTITPFKTEDESGMCLKHDTS